MTPERWRAVDVVLQAALELAPDQRGAFVQEACGHDEGLRREVSSLLVAHDAMSADFLERPAVGAFGGPAPRPPNEATSIRLAAALAGRYAIERELARGGMATVYLARDLRHDRHVAIKLMRDEVAAAVGAERFLEEIRVTALLRHPHILPLFDSGSESGLLWYVMPFVEGETLRSRLTREKRLSVAEATRVAREVADALEHAHARGIVHRDVKPENILLQDGHAFVSDFGIALALENAGGERLTRTGLTLGTPQYMAPEQAAGERALDARVDVYALGAVLYEMLAGEAPFAAESRQAVLLRILREPPTALAVRRADVPPTIDSGVRRALAKRADDRFATAGAFAAALVDTPAQPQAVDPSPRRMVPVRMAVYAGIAGVVIGVLGGWTFARWSLASGGAPSGPVVVQPSPANVSTAADMASNVAASDGGLSLVLLDRAGQVQQQIRANRPWTPRFSPDGRRVAYGAFGSGRTTSDIWVTDLRGGKTRRLTDDDRDSNDPQWSPDGRTIAYSAGAPGGKDVFARPADGGDEQVLMSRPGTQYPSDWARTGGSLVVTEEGGSRAHDILVQPADGSEPWPYAATAADELAGRVSPDGHWIAYTYASQGRSDVYLDSYPRPGRRLMVSQSGGLHPVWRGDGRELYYWRRDTLVAVALGTSTASTPPAIGRETALFSAPYQDNVNTMYDVSPNGDRFVIVERR